ncbi:hypothetical protein ACFW04_013901 [Cataglyphis niger]
MKEGKERRSSYGNVEELSKRKREDPGLRKGEEDVFKNRKKSGLMKDAELGWIEREGELQHSMKSWKWREEIKKMKEDVKEGIREQEERVSEEIEKVRKEFRESEKNGRKKKKKTKQPSLLHSNFNCKIATSNRATRAPRDILFLPQCRTELYKRSFRFTSARFWNGLSQSTWNATTLADFKQKLYLQLLVCASS